MHFFRIKFLKGGLAAWKAKDYPVESYQELFHLDTARLGGEVQFGDYRRFGLLRYLPFATEFGQLCV